MRFIHIADVHLGAKPDRDRPWAALREQHSWQALTAVVTRAQEEQADLLLVAGDLFHRQPLLKELKEVNYQFSRLSHTQVVLIAGNHDYLNPDSYYRTFNWTQQVHFLKQEKLDYIEIPMLHTRVYGLSYWHRELPKPMYQMAEVEKGSFYNILLAHGGDEKHIPFRANDILKAGFDYAACGHIHKPMQLIENRVVMAGALQPIDCNDMGEHGYFTGEITKNRCRVTFCPLTFSEYISLNLKVNREITNGELEAFVAARVQEAPKYQLFKVILSGFSDSEVPLDQERLLGMERVVQVVNQTRPDYDFEWLKIQYEHQLPGRYIKAMEEMPQNEITKKALYYGIEALLEN